MKKTSLKTIIFIGYFLACFILNKLNFFSFSFLFLKSVIIDLMFWFGGAFLGAHFLKIDQLIWVYFTRPEEPLSLQIKLLIKQRKIGQVWDLLDEKAQEQKELALRGVLFQAILVILAFFTLTSISSVFGKTLVMAIGLKLLLEEWEDFLEKKDYLWAFWQIKREVSFKEQKVFLYLMTGIFGILSLLLI